MLKSLVGLRLTQQGSLFFLRIHAHGGKGKWPIWNRRVAAASHEMRPRIFPISSNWPRAESKSRQVHKPNRKGETTRSNRIMQEKDRNRSQVSCSTLTDSRRADLVRRKESIDALAFSIRLDSLYSPSQDLARLCRWQARLLWQLLHCFHNAQQIAGCSLSSKAEVLSLTRASIIAHSLSDYLDSV